MARVEYTECRHTERTVVERIHEGDRVRYCVECLLAELYQLRADVKPEPAVPYEDLERSVEALTRAHGEASEQLARIREERDALLSAVSRISQLVPCVTGETALDRTVAGVEELWNKNLSLEADLKTLRSCALVTQNVLFPRVVVHLDKAQEDVPKETLFEKGPLE